MSIQVHVSGPVFAQLLHEHAVSENDQEGLLLGESSVRITDQINDQMMHNEHQETIIKICSFVSCDAFSFYDKNLNLDEERMRDLVGGDNIKSVIGYYKFRRNTPMEPTFRERFLCQTLSKHVDNFLFGLFTSSFSNDFAIHSMDHAFMTFLPNRGQPAQYKHVKLRIVNLGENGSNDYRMAPGSAASINSGEYSDILRKIQYDGNADPTVRMMEGVHSTLHARLEKVAQKIIDTQTLIEEYHGMIKTGLEMDGSGEQYML